MFGTHTSVACAFALTFPQNLYERVSEHVETFNELDFVLLEHGLGLVGILFNLPSEGIKWHCHRSTQFPMLLTKVSLRSGKTQLN